MVLYKKEKATLSEPLVLPSEFGVDTKVFVIRETGEWFPKYQDYIKRLWFYMQNNFTCEITSHANLTFFQAMASEEEEFNRLEMRFPIKIRAPMAEFLHFNPTSRFDLLLEETYFKFKKLFFVDEVVFLNDMNVTDSSGNIINNISDNIFVTEFLKNHNMYFDREAAESFQIMNGYDDSTTEIGVDLSNKWEVKEVFDMGPDVPRKYRIYQPSSFIFIEVNADELRRERKSYTRHLVRSFMKLTLEKASRKNGSPWRVKEDYIQHYDLSPEWPVQFLKFKEVPKSIGLNSEIPDGLHPKKRGRPKSSNSTIENDDKLGKKKAKSNKKDILSPDFQVTEFLSPVSNEVSNVNEIADGFDSSSKSTPEPTPPPQKPKFVFNPNVVKPKLAIVNDDEIPRVISKLNDILPSQDVLQSIRQIAIENVKELDKYSKPKSDEELEELFSSLFFYGEAKEFQHFMQPGVLKTGFRQYDENFSIKGFSKNRNSDIHFDFFLILRIYIFMMSFNEVLCLEIPTFQEYLIFLNNENQNSFRKKSLKQVAFQFVNKKSDDQLGLVLDLKTKMNSKLFAQAPSLDIVSLENNEDEVDILSENNPNFNKFSLELICCLLRLFINEKGDWSVEIPNKWYSLELKKDIEKEEAISTLFNEQESEFLASCSKYKDVSFSERLMKRNFGNGNWCLILMGIFEDSMHVLPLQNKMKDIIKKFIGDESVFGSKTLNAKLLSNFAENFEMNDRLNIIFVLMEIVTNYSVEIKQEVDKLSEYTTFLKSERFQTARSVKTLIKEKTSLASEKQKMETSTNDESSMKDLESKLEVLEKQVISKEQVKEFWENQVRCAVQLRSKSLGTDRYGNTYWFLESHGIFDLNTLGELTGNELKRSGKIFIQGPKKNEIPMYYQGISYEEYLQKIEKYKVLEDGSILNDESKLILIANRVWNNNYTNKDLTVLDWKFIDYGNNFLVSEDDWCFIDDNNNLKELLNWLYKFGSSERNVKSNIMAILDTYNKEQLNNQFLYNEILEVDGNTEILKTAMDVYSSLNDEDIEVLRKMNEQHEHYDIWNKTIKENTPLDQPGMIKEGEILEKICQMNSLINDILQNDSKRNLEKMKTGYTNKEAVKYFKKNLQNGIAEVKNVKKGKKKVAAISTVTSLAEKIENIKDELHDFVSRRGLDEYI